MKDKLIRLALENMRCPGKFSRHGWMWAHAVEHQHIWHVWVTCTH